MNNFIEVTINDKKILINLNHIEEIHEEEDRSCTIYYAFNIPNAIEQDYIKPKESYKKVRNMIRKIKG